MVRPRREGVRGSGEPGTAATAWGGGAAPGLIDPPALMENAGDGTKSNPRSTGGRRVGGAPLLGVFAGGGCGAVAGGWVRLVPRKSALIFSASRAGRRVGQIVNASKAVPSGEEQVSNKARLASDQARGLALATRRCQRFPRLHLLATPDYGLAHVGHASGACRPRGFFSGVCFLFARIMHAFR